MHPNAVLAKDVIIADGSIIEDGVVVESGVQIGFNVVLRSGTHIGQNCRIGDGSILGRSPVKAALSATTLTQDNSVLLVLEDSVLVGAGTILYKGAKIASHAFIADLASIREEVVIGEYSIVGRGVSIENNVSIGRKVKIETGTYITAFSLIEDYCFIAPEVVFSNDNFLGRTEERKKYFKGPALRKGARIGTNATLLPNIEIGEDALVAAGAVVTKNVVPRVIVAGNPARFLRTVPEDQWIENQVFYDKD